MTWLSNCICLILIGFQAVGSAASLDEGFLQINFLERKKEINGQVSQAFQLVWPDHCSQPPKVFYSELAIPTLYQAKLDGDRFTIYADRFSRFHIVAVAQDADTQTLLTATTDVMLFGKSAQHPKRLKSPQNAVKSLSRLPEIQLVSPKTFYWHQTGQTFGFQILIGGQFDSTKQTHISVLENRSITPDKTGTTLYTPSHDMRLRYEGNSATRQDILFAVLPDEKEKLTYTLTVHRSRYAFRDIPFGLITAGATLVFFVGLILFKRRTPW